MTTATAAPASAIIEETVGTVPASQAPIKLNASALEKLRALFGETEIGRMGKLDLERTITKFNEQVLQAEEHKAEKQGALIATLAEYIRRHKPSYKDIAALILTTEAKHAIASKRRVFQAAKGLPEVSEREGANPYRQFATRYVKLAKWTLGEFSKHESPVDSVTIMGVQYFTPVDALLSGMSLYSAFNAWKWAATPRNAGLRLGDLKTRPTAEVAKEQALSITVPVRKLNKDKTQENRVRVPVAGHVEATFGTIMGLLECMEAKDDLRFSEIQGQALVVLIDKLTEGHEDDPTAS